MIIGLSVVGVGLSGQWRNNEMLTVWHSVHKLPISSLVKLTSPIGVTQPDETPSGVFGGKTELSAGNADERVGDRVYASSRSRRTGIGFALSYTPFPSSSHRFGRHLPFNPEWPDSKGLKSSRYKKAQLPPPLPPRPPHIVFLGLDFRCL